jgi:hypothetical protein
VPVDLIVRGFCCLRPGVAGRTGGIRVRSITGRFLEHSRIFRFAAASDDPVRGEFFIGSPDWMFRNFSKRVEVVTPIFDEEAEADCGKFWIFACGTGAILGLGESANTRNCIPMEPATDRKQTELMKLSWNESARG